MMGLVLMVGQPAQGQRLSLKEGRPVGDLPPHHVGQPAQGQSLFLKEGGSITVTKTSSGDLTAREDSYFSTISHAFSQQKGCSTVKLQGDNANFTVQFYVAHLLEQYTISYVVVDKSGSVINTTTINSIPEAAGKICELISAARKEPPQPKCSPAGKGKKGACETDDAKRLPRKMSYY